MDKEKHMSSLYGFISTNGSISLPVIKKNAEAEKNESEDTDSDELEGTKSIEVGLAWKTQMMREFDETEALIEENKTRNNLNKNQDEDNGVARMGGNSIAGRDGGEGGKGGAAKDQDEIWSKRVYYTSFAVKMIVVLSTVASIAFGAEATPNIEILACGYSHRPVIVSVFICLNLVILLAAAFLLFYQVWPRPKEKIKIPIRIMDFAVFIIMLLTAMINGVFFTLWSSEALSVKLEYCKIRPRKSGELCNTEENCGILKDMKFMAVGALVFSGTIFFSLVIGFAVVCHDIRRKNAYSAEAKQLINRLRQEE